MAHLQQCDVTGPGSARVPACGHRDLDKRMKMIGGTLGARDLRCSQEITSIRQLSFGAKKQLSKDSGKELQYKHSSNISFVHFLHRAAAGVEPAPVEASLEKKVGGTTLPRPLQAFCDSTRM
jgi:hypothetical protein